MVLGLLSGLTLAYGQGNLDWSDYQTNFSISIFSPNPENPGLGQTGNTIYDLPPGNAVYYGGWIGNTMAAPGGGVGPTPTDGPDHINYQLNTNFEVGLYVGTSGEAVYEALYSEMPLATAGIGWEGTYNTFPMVVSVPGLPAGTQVFVALAAWYSGGGAGSYAEAVGAGVPVASIQSTNSVALTAAPDPPASLGGIGLTSFSLTYGFPLIPTHITWSNPAPIIYGTPLSSIQLNATASGGGLLSYSPNFGAVLDAGSNTLYVDFSPVESNGYNWASDSVSLLVLPAPLTVSAANASRLYGLTNPVFSGTIKGLTNGDNITANYTCSATSNSPPGTYAITPALVDPDHRLVNYTVTTNAGTLLVFEPPNILSAMPTGNSFTFTWSAISNQTYQIQTTTNLGQGNWIYLAAPVTATNSAATISAAITPTHSSQFYRIVLLP